MWRVTQVPAAMLRMLAVSFRSRILSITTGVSSPQQPSGLRRSQVLTDECFAWEHPLYSRPLRHEKVMLIYRQKLAYRVVLGQSPELHVRDNRFSRCAEDAAAIRCCGP